MPQWPYLDPDSCPDDAQRKGSKLCPRCSKPGEPCCDITREPLSAHRLGDMFTQAEILERQNASKFPTEEDYRQHKWACEPWCDSTGNYTH